MHLLLPLLTLLSTVLSQSVDPPWVSQTFTFGWPGTYNSTMIRCRVLNITFLARPSAAPDTAPPYELVLITAGRSPLKVPAGGTGSFLWTVNLDLGGPYMLSTYDSAGGSGGVSPRPRNRSSCGFNVLVGAFSLDCPCIQRCRRYCQRERLMPVRRNDIGHAELQYWHCSVSTHILLPFPWRSFSLNSADHSAALCL